MQVSACSFVSQCDFQVTTIFFINYGILLKNSIMYVMLEEYHFLKCEEQFFSSNIINSPYRGLISVAENLAQFVSHQCSAGAQCGSQWSRVIALHSLERDRTSVFSKQTAGTSCTMSGSEDTCCPLSLWCFSVAGGHSVGCRTSWVCLQHHARVVTTNGVRVCGSKFPPTVSKHSQHQ